MKNLIFDTDIGTDIDDALALIFLLNQKKIKLSQIITSHGPTLLRAKIALTLLNSLNKNTLVIKGLTKPFSHRKIWLSGFESKKVNQNLKPCHQTLSKSLKSLKRKAIILSTGPLTNIAHLKKKGLLTKHCQHLFIMGGVLPEKNLPKLEHNFSADPLAAHIAFQSKIPITLIPLNITIKFPLSKKQISSLINHNSTSGQLISNWITNWIKTTKTFSKSNPFFNQVFLHDPIAAAIACGFPGKIKKININICKNSGKINTSKGKAINLLTQISPKTVNNIFKIITKAL